jgi:hypothetical protein
LPILSSNHVSHRRAVNRRPAIATPICLVGGFTTEQT